MKRTLKIAQFFMATAVFYFAVSCCKVVFTSSYKYVNDSGHSLHVELYLGGKVQTQYGFDLANSSSVFPFGTKNEGGGCPDALLGESDSTIVTFDDGKIATHYNSHERSDPSRTIPLVGKNPNAITSRDSRGLYGDGGYKQRVIGKRSRCSDDVESTYTFTEQDYLDAK